MAASKEYAYYIKGNKVAIVQKDYTLEGGLNYTYNDDGLGIGTSGTAWKSPKASITDGLEIQYTYSPTYTFPDVQVYGTQALQTQFYVNGWTVVDGYLTLVRSDMTWSNKTSVDVDDNIYIGGSSRWNGLHKIKEIQDYGDVTHGGIKTYTKVTENVPFIHDTSVSWNTTEIISDLESTGMAGTFTDSTTTPYLWIMGSDAISINNGFFSGWKVGSITELDLSEGARYRFYQTQIVEEDTIAPSFTSDTLEDIYIYKAYHDSGMYFITDVAVMEDESFELDISRYQANAVVQYVKSRYLEDAGNVEMKEYYMREFRRMVEKHESGKKRGVYRTQGFDLFR